MEDELYGGLDGTIAAQGAPDVGLYDGIFAEAASSGHHETYLQHKINELEEVLRGSLDEIKNLQAQLHDRNQQLVKVTWERDTLLRNISCLYNTAKEEMARKQNEINGLRAEVAQAKLQHPQPQHMQRVRSQPTTTLEWKPPRASPPPIPPRPPLAPPATRQVHTRHSPAPYSVSDVTAINACTSHKRLREGSTDLEDGEVGRCSSLGGSREPDEVSDAKRPRHAGDEEGPQGRSSKPNRAGELDAVAEEAFRRRADGGQYLRPGEETGCQIQHAAIHTSSVEAAGRSACRDRYEALPVVPERQDRGSHGQAGPSGDAGDHTEALGEDIRGGLSNERRPAAREREKVYGVDLQRSESRAEQRAGGLSGMRGEPRAVSSEREIRVPSADQAWQEPRGQRAADSKEMRGEKRPVSSERATDVHRSDNRRQVRSDRDAACARGLRDRLCGTGKEHDKDEAHHKEHRRQERSSRHASGRKDPCDENRGAGGVKERNETHRTDYRHRERSDHRAIDPSRQHSQPWASGDGSSHRRQVERCTPERKVLRDENRVVVSDGNMCQKRLLAGRLSEEDMQGREREGRDQCQNGQNSSLRQRTSTDGDREEGARRLDNGRLEGCSGRDSRGHGRGAA